MDFDARFTKDGLKIERQRLIGDEVQIERYPWEDLELVEIVDADEWVDETSSGPPYTVKIAGAKVEVESKHETPNEEFGDFKKMLEKEIGMKIYYGGGVKFDEDKTNNDNFKEFIIFLFKHGYLSRSKLPIYMPEATKNFIINDSKETGNDGKMDHAKPINTPEGEVYYNPKDPLGQKREHIWYLVENYVLNE